MGCCGERERPEKISDTQKWDYINLSDFKARSCITPFSYVILYILLFISIACYVVDLFTAVQLLIFDRWSGRIEPAISLSISRWVFLGCIIASYMFLAYRWWRALRAIKSGGIAQSYLDPLAVRLQSVRMGRNGRGWRRFLVFAEMTKGKKGADYIALFTFFSFEAWYRIIFAEAPRNVINAVTVYSVFKADLIPDSQNIKVSPIMQFLNNVKVLADGDWVRATVLVGMLFVLITWTIAAMSLALSCIFYVCFLWRHISRTDKSLRSFCKRRIDARLSRIVDEKVDKALLKADAKRAKLDVKTGRSGENIADIRKAPTLPNVEPAGADMLPAMPLARQNTNTTMGTYASVPNSDLSRPDMLRRMDTNGSTSSFRSFGSNAPLMGEAGPMGMSAPPPRSYSPAPPSRMDSERSMPPRSYTPSGRPAFHVGAPPSPLNRTNTTGSSAGTAHLISPLEPGYGPGPSPTRQNTGFSNYSNQGRSSPVPGLRPPPVQEYEMRSHTPQGIPNRANTSSPFQQPPNRANTASPFQPPNRNNTSSPFRPYNPYKSPTQRSFTAPQGQFNGPPQAARNFSSPVYGGPPQGGPPRSNPRGPPGPPLTYDASIYDQY